MNTKAIVTISLVLNVILVASTAHFWSRSRIGDSPESITTAATTNLVAAPTSKPSGTEPQSATSASADTAGSGGSQFDWRRVESPDYRQYIANLRAIGCPDKTIRDIITADVSELFRERAKAELGTTNRYEYWKPGVPFANVFNEKMVAKQQELGKEKRELLKVLLGDNAPSGWDSSSMMDTSQQVLGQMLDFLPQDKLGPLMELEQKYGAKLMETVKSAQQGDSGPMKKVLAEKDKEMLALLSPEQKFEYDLRMSQSSMTMRMQMGEFEPNEQEFREMFKLKKSFDDEFGVAGLGLGANASKEERTRREAAQKQMDEQVKSILGEDRHRTMTYEQRWMYDPLRSVAKDFNVPKESAFTVFDLQKEAEAQAVRVRQNQALSDGQREAALAGIRSETEKTVTQVLGPAAAQEYVQKAPWLKNVGNK